MSYWTTTAPTLPSGASWKKVTTGGRKENNVSVSMEIHIARLSQNNTAIRFKMTSSEGEYGTYYPPGWVGFKVGNSTKAYGWARAVTAYWTGAMNEGTTYAVSGGGGDSSSSPFNHNTYATGTATGPAYVAPVYTITYRANNGGSSSSTQSKTYGYTATIRSTNWTKAGHTFVRWNTAADGSGTNYSAGAGYSTNADLTLYAVWSPNTFAVTYNANGGTGTTAGQTKTYGTALTLRSNGFTPPTGNHFSEWNTASDGSGTGYAAGGTYTANAAAVLYAQWAPDTYAVTFDGNGADGGAQAPETKIHGSRLMIPGCTYTRTGYSFSEWNTAADATGTDYAAGSYYETNAAVTLYAIWTKDSLPVYLNDSGTIRRAAKAYMNIGGTVNECEVYININGEIAVI